MDLSPISAFSNKVGSLSIMDLKPNTWVLGYYKHSFYGNPICIQFTSHLWTPVTTNWFHRSYDLSPQHKATNFVEGKFNLGGRDGREISLDPSLRCLGRTWPDPNIFYKYSGSDFLGEISLVSKFNKYSKIKKKYNLIKIYYFTYI